MASLKEIKGRIASVKNTLKTTSAMKLVASAKLHKAQMAIEGMLPYSQRLTGMVNNLLNNEQVRANFTSPLMKERKVKRVAIVTISSSASLCGGFNHNIIRLTQQVVDEYQKTLGMDGVVLIPIGRKIAQAFSTIENLKLIDNHITDGEKLTYEKAATLSTYLIDSYLQGQIDRVELLYTHYKNMAVQVLMREPFLPIETAINEQQTTNHEIFEAIIEPSAPELLHHLLPQALAIRLFTTLLDSGAAEHAARTFAMQQATDNGEGLLQELNLMYNKGRQQAITNELLDIMGGQMK